MKKLKKYIALGDSLTVGVGKGIFSPGFVQLYERFMKNDLQQRVCLQGAEQQRKRY